VDRNAEVSDVGCGSFIAIGFGQIRDLALRASCQTVREYVDTTVSQKIRALEPDAAIRKA